MGESMGDYRKTTRFEKDFDRKDHLKGTRNENVKRLEISLDVDSSLKGWTENCFIRRKKGNTLSLNEKKPIWDSVYCEVLGNESCTKCKTTSKKLTGLNSSLAKHPEIETGGYLLFLTMNEKQHKTPQSEVMTSALSTSVPPDSGYSSGELMRRNTPIGTERTSSRSRIRSASAAFSEFRRLPGKSSGRPTFSFPEPWRPKSVRFDVSSNSGQRASNSRMSNSSSSSSGRRVSALSKEGWSVKQLEAWRLLAPTPPQLEVSQMNVSMYTPKELPGIKIFDESFFVI